MLWFNFLAGFAYLAAAVGIALARRWATCLSLGIAAATVFVFLAFCAHALAGGAFEPRTVGAMTLRSGFWLVAGALCWREGCRKRQGR